MLEVIKEFAEFCKHVMNVGGQSRLSNYCDCDDNNMDCNY